MLYRSPLKIKIVGKQIKSYFNLGFDELPSWWGMMTNKQNRKWKTWIKKIGFQHRLFINKVQAKEIINPGGQRSLNYIFFWGSRGCLIVRCWFILIWRWCKDFRNIGVKISGTGIRPSPMRVRCDLFLSYMSALCHGMATFWGDRKLGNTVLVPFSGFHLLPIKQPQPQCDVNVMLKIMVVGLRHTTFNWTKAKQTVKNTKRQKWGAAFSL